MGTFGEGWYEVLFPCEVGMVVKSLCWLEVVGEDQLLQHCYFMKGIAIRNYFIDLNLKKEVYHFGFIFSSYLLDLNCLLNFGKE